MRHQSPRCTCTPRQSFPRITPEQVADLRARLYALCRVFQHTGLVEEHYLPRLLGRLKARSLTSLNQPQYRSALAFLDEDTRAAKHMVKHARQAMLAWSFLKHPRGLDLFMCAPYPTGGKPYEILGHAIYDHTA